MRCKIKKPVWLLLPLLAACNEEPKGTPIEQSVAKLVESMQGKGDFDDVDVLMVADKAVRPDWKVMADRERASWDWTRLYLQERVGDRPKMAQMHVVTLEESVSHQSSVLVTFEGAPDTLWLFCGTRTGYILNMGFYNKGRIVTDAAD